MRDKIAIIICLSVVVGVCHGQPQRRAESTTFTQLQRAAQLIKDCIYRYSSSRWGSTPHLDRLQMASTYLSESIDAYQDNKQKKLYIKLQTTEQLLFDTVYRYRSRWYRTDLNRLLDAQQILHAILKGLENKSDDQCDSTVDIAIIGAGVSGTYTAWRMRNDNRRIALYEYSNRVGGRMFTVKLNGGLKAELGGMRFYPDAHTRWVKVANELGLTIVPFGGAPEHDDQHSAYYFRGTRRRYNQTNKVGDFPGFPVRAGERNMNVEDLQWMILNKTVDVAAQASADPNDYITRDGRKLRDLGVWNMITQQASSGVWEFLKANFPFDDELLNANAALSEVAIAPDPSKKKHDDPNKTKVYTLKEGFSAVPIGLADRFLRASRRHSLHRNRLLKSIKKVGSRLHLGFAVTRTSNGNTWETQEKEIVCADKVILGISVESLKLLDWDPIHSNEQVKEDINSYRGFPAIKAYLGYDRPWWRHLQDIRWVLTDLPNRQTMETELFPDGSAALLATYSTDDNTEFWEGLMTGSPAVNGNIPNKYNITENFIDQLYTFVAESMGINKAAIPAPKSAAVHIWKSDPVGYAWYTVHPGYHWRPLRDRLTKPHKDHEVYIVSTIGTLDDTSWGDGAMKIAEYTLGKHFNKRPL